MVVEGNMAEKKTNPRTATAQKFFLPAGIFLFLAIIWAEPSTSLRVALGAAGLAFAGEGLWKLWKLKRNGSS